MLFFFYFANSQLASADVCLQSSHYICFMEFYTLILSRKMDEIGRINLNKPIRVWTVKYSLMSWMFASLWSERAAAEVRVTPIQLAEQKTLKVKFTRLILSEFYCTCDNDNKHLNILFIYLSVWQQVLYVFLQQNFPVNQ